MWNLFKESVHTETNSVFINSFRMCFAFWFWASLTKSRQPWKFAWQRLPHEPNVNCKCRRQRSGRQSEVGKVGDSFSHIGRETWRILAFLFDSSGMFNLEYRSMQMDNYILKSFFLYLSLLFRENMCILAYEVPAYSNWMKQPVKLLSDTKLYSQVILILLPHMVLPPFIAC